MNHRTKNGTMPTRRAMVRLLRHAFLVIGTLGVLAIFPVGCAARRTGPYTTGSESVRHPMEADRLNQAAVAVIDTDPARAEQLLRDALTADLYHGPAHNNLGTVYLAQGRLYEASEEFQFAKRCLPGHPDPRLNLALTLEMAGRTDDALATYRTALDVYPEHIPTLQALTRLQIRAGRTDADTARNLSILALRGETAEWREWARHRAIGN